MREEIIEQPAVLARLAKNELKYIGIAAKEIINRDLKFGVIAARGTSDHAAVYGKYLLEIENGIPIGLSAPSVHTLYNSDVNYSNCFVIGISQSGESPDVAEVLVAARKKGALTIAITNKPESTVAKAAEISIYLNAGLEKSVAATKTYTATLAVFILLSEALKGGISTNPLDGVAEKMALALNSEDEIKNLVERYRFMRECVVLARGINLATANEAALKMIETCILLAKPYSSADFLHGPVALVHSGFPVIMYAPEGKAFEQAMQVADRMKAEKAELLTITNSKELIANSTRSLKVDFDVDEKYSPAVYILYAQLFACYLSLTRGLNPDKPEGLSKVTQTL